MFPHLPWISSELFLDYFKSVFLKTIFELYMPKILAIGKKLKLNALIK